MLSIWGPPIYLLSDNGSQFVTEEFKIKCNNLGINKIFARTYHPQGNSVAEAFHQFLKRTTSAILPYSPFSLAEIIVTVLQAYRTTPHPETGETPLRLLTGQDSMLPHWQEWEAVTLDNWESNTRLHMLTRIRYNAFQHMVKKIAWRNAKDKHTKKHQKLQIGDLVICWLRPNEVEDLLKRFGNTKMMPSRSEPCRVVRFGNGDESVVIVKSIWHEKIIKRINVHDVTKIPENLRNELGQISKYELLGDLKQHRALDQKKSQCDMEPIMGEERPLTSTNQKDTITQGCLSFEETDGHQSRSSNEDKENHKKRRVELVCSVYSHGDMPLQEGDSEPPRVRNYGTHEKRSCRVDSKILSSDKYKSC